MSSIPVLPRFLSLQSDPIDLRMPTCCTSGSDDRIQSHLRSTQAPPTLHSTLAQTQGVLQIDVGTLCSPCAVVWQTPRTGTNRQASAARRPAITFNNPAIPPQSTGSSCCQYDGPCLQFPSRTDRSLIRRSVTSASLATARGGHPCSLLRILRTKKVSHGEGLFLSAKDQPFQARYMEVAV
jgi:hypothetical protein